MLFLWVRDLFAPPLLCGEDEDEDADGLSRKASAEICHLKKFNFNFCGVVEMNNRL
jgi:hypothetical protein